MAEDIKIVYKGSRAEGLWIHEVLKEEGIGAILKDTLSSSIQAGWADGYPEDAVRIYVEMENFEKAEEIIKNYFENRNSSEENNENNNS